MGRLILQMNVTLDGCCDHTQVIADEELHQYSEDMMDQSDGLLFGREIYQLMESAWPAIASNSTGPQFLVDFARKLDRKPKYVFSRTLDQVSWQNSFLLKGSRLRGGNAASGRREELARQRRSRPRLHPGTTGIGGRVSLPGTAHRCRTRSPIVGRNSRSTESEADRDQTFRLRRRAAQLHARSLTAWHWRTNT